MQFEFHLIFHQIPLNLNRKFFFIGSRYNWSEFEAFVTQNANKDEHKYTKAIFLLY
jgi:hypothetical protein